MSATTTVVGNTTADIELRYSAAGNAVANVTVAVSDRKFDRQRNEWVDGDVWFARCSLFGDLAEHAAASIHKGTRVIGFGRIVQRSWEDREGQKRTSVEVILDAIGPELRHATAQVTRVQTSQQGQTAPTAASVSDEPWSTPTGAQTDAWGGETYGEPPF